VKNGDISAVIGVAKKKQLSPFSPTRRLAFGMGPIASKAAIDESLVYITFTPRNPGSREYARLIREGIKLMRTTGELNRILARHHLKDWREEYKDVMETYR